MEIYLYDASNRRVKIDVHYGSGVDTEFAYDGWQVVEEHYEDGGYPQVRQFVYGAYIDEPLMVEDQNGDCFFYHQNTIYSVYGITDEMGDVAEEYEYDPYGRHTASQGFEDNPYTFTGRRYDPESGLHYYRMRYYDAERGRFISRDPIAAVISMVSHYAYAENQPTYYLDPSGRQSECAKCGVDATSVIKNTIQHIRETYNSWVDKYDSTGAYEDMKVIIDNCMHLRSHNGCDMLELKNIGYVTPPAYSLPPLRCASGQCINTVQYNDGCYHMGEVNYITYGVMTKLCYDFVDDYDKRHPLHRVFKRRFSLEKIRADVELKSRLTNWGKLTETYKYAIEWATAGYTGGSPPKQRGPWTKCKPCPKPCTKSRLSYRFGYHVSQWDEDKKKGK